MNYQPFTKLYIKDIMSLMSVRKCKARTLIKDIKDDFKLGSKDLLYCHFLFYFNVSNTDLINLTRNILPK